jgi:hypothetical protein
VIRVRGDTFFIAIKQGFLIHIQGIRDAGDLALVIAKPQQHDISNITIIYVNN